MVACELEQNANQFLAVAAPFRHDGGRGDVEEGGAAFGGDGFGEHSFSCVESVCFFFECNSKAARVN